MEAVFLLRAVEVASRRSLAVVDEPYSIARDADIRTSFASHNLGIPRIRSSSKIVPRYYIIYT
jgi:hypothetical protein